MVCFYEVLAGLESGLSRAEFRGIHDILLSQI
jgi:hypothetical protein